MQYLANISDNFIFTWDLGIIAFLFFVAFFFGMNAGARRLVSVTLALYFANILFQNTPYLREFLGGLERFQALAIETGIFIAAALFIFLIVIGSPLLPSLRAPKKDESRWWHILLLAVTATGLFAASLLAFFPELYYNNLSAITLKIFVLNNALFWWSLAGIIIFFILRKTKKKV